MSRSAETRRTFFFEEPIFERGANRPPKLNVRTEANNLFICTPHIFHDDSDPGRDDIDAVLRELLDEMFATYDIQRPILWFYTPMALGFARHVKAAATVYDCMDELSAFRGAPPLLRELEQELFERADVVFTGGQSLYEAKCSQHPNVSAFPSSVDARHFGRARREIVEPADQATIARPRIGYFGVIDERLDLELIAHLADSDPFWQIVMVGPVVKIDPSSLPRRENIHYLGQKDYAALPAYLAGWDVAMMPFALNESTKFISPTKTLEYLAAGKPVVSTAIRDVVRPYGEKGLARIADAASFPKEVTYALADRGTSRRLAADAFVAQTSWDATWSAMDAAIERAIVDSLERTESGRAAWGTNAGSNVNSATNNDAATKQETACSTI